LSFISSQNLRKIIIMYSDMINLLLNIDRNIFKAPFKHTLIVRAVL